MRAQRLQSITIDLDPAGRVAAVDAPAFGPTEMAAYSDLVGKETHEWVHADDRSTVADVVQAANGSGGPQGISFRLHADSDQGWHWVSGHAAPAAAGGTRLVLSPTGQTVESLAPGERQAALAAAALWAAVEAVITIDADGIIVSANPMTTRVFGYDEPELLGQNVSMLMPEPYRSEHDGYLARYLESGEPHVLGIGREVQAQRKDGTVFPVWLALGEVSVEGRRLFTGVLSDLTERHAHEQDLQRFFELSLDLMTIVSFDGTVVRVNPAFERVLGYTADELAGVRYLDFVHPDDLGRAVEALAQLEAGSTVSFEGRVRCRDGGFRTLAWVIGSVPARSLIYGSGRDVTERRAAETALRESEMRLQAILDNAPSPITLKSLDGEYLVVNRAAEGLRGMPIKDILGLRPDDIVPGQGSVVDKHDAMVLEAGHPMVFEESFILPSGTHTFLVARFPLTNLDGEVYALGSIATDITERDVAAGELAERERLLNGIYRATPDIIAVVTRKGVIRSVSTAVQRALGYAPDALAGVDVWALVHPDDRTLVESAIDDALARSSATIAARCRLRRRDGSWVHTEMRGQVLGGDDADAQMFVFSCRDITAQIRIEERLQAAREDAERANEAKSEFLSRMSHELRTPLNAVLGFAQLLQLGADIDRDQAVGRIIRAGKHLLDLINEVLDLAGIESGSVTIDLEPVDLRDVVADAIDLSRPAAARAGVALHAPAWPPAGRGCFVMADRQRVLQVLLNLVSNAIKYNRRGGQVVVGHSHPSDDEVRVSVTDSGKGIRPEDRDRVFSPFDRIGAEHSDIEGAGVGLHLCLNLAERMGGTITFESTVGLGTTFHLTLPQAPAEGLEVPADPAAQPVAESGAVHAAGTPAMDGPADGTAPIAGGPLRVVCIDDSEANQMMIAAALSRSGIEVVRALNGVVGLELIRRDRPHAILLDLHLPGVDGFALLDELRVDPSTAPIPVIVTTADVSPAARERTTRAGAVAHLTKPFDLGALVDLITAHATGVDGRDGLRRA